MKITFLGAASEVTGSQHLIETDSARVLLDCGLFQGQRDVCRVKNQQFKCDPANLDAVILSHAHIDHSGNLPRLSKLGFTGPVFCTDPTADIASIMLRDSAKIQAEDAKYLIRKGIVDREKVEPLYKEADARAIVRQMQPVEYEKWTDVADGVKVRLFDAGHILGSAIVELEIEDAGELKRVVFSGDLGRRNKPILNDPSPVANCDALICESTYGNRTHPPAADIKNTLREVVEKAIEQKGRVIIPAFSLGRTQLVLYFLNELRHKNIIPRIPVFVDSPLATRLTDVYRRYQDFMDDDVQELLKTDRDVFDFDGLTYVQSQKESMAINKRRDAFVVISASGMCENGRVVHHLKQSISHSANQILVIGYQARHTLGRRLVERREKVKIHDRMYPLRAEVKTINGLSAHADVADLKWWFEQISAAGGARRVFLVHGERESSEALAEVIRNECDEDPVIPELYESFEI